MKARAIIGRTIEESIQGEILDFTQF
jgi:hypothetical protein